MHELRIRRETEDDVAGVHRVVERAFAAVEHSDQTEPHIVDALRRDGALTVSLVAVSPDVIGHAGASPVTISDGTEGWFGIGPVAVDPDHQGRGVGSALMERLAMELRTAGAHGAVLLGEPQFYSRFGFSTLDGLVYPGAPAGYFLALPLRDDPAPRGAVTYHRAFTAARP